MSNSLFQQRHQTPRHILQTCTLLKDLIVQAWPQGGKKKSLDEKLWGKHEVLLLLMRFTEASHLFVSMAENMKLNTEEEMYKEREAYFIIYFLKVCI